MSRIFDALENAQKEGVTSNLPVEPPPLPPVSLPVDNQRANADVDMEHEMIALYQTITAALPHTDHRSVLIVGSRSNEGTSTIARELAKVASLRLEKNVLLIDLDRSRPEHHIYTNFTTGSSIIEQSPETGSPRHRIRWSTTSVRSKKAASMSCPFFSGL